MRERFTKQRIKKTPTSNNILQNCDCVVLLTEGGFRGRHDFIKFVLARKVAVDIVGAGSGVEDDMGVGVDG